LTASFFGRRGKSSGESAEKSNSCAFVWKFYNDVIKVQNSAVNNMSNATTIQKANTKSSVGQHGPPTNAKVGSGAMEE
jgi:hypothetical protein